MVKQFVLSALGATVGRPLVNRHSGKDVLAPVPRADFVASVPTDGMVLEIGPFDRPWLSGSNIRYFDVLAQEGLRERASIEPERRPENCPFIHFVSPTGDLSIVEGQYGAIFSSHCIEHQPDLLRHLRHVEQLLAPGGGYYLIIPDKRFCFDHFLAESGIEDIRAARGRTLHTEEAIAEHLIGTTHNNKFLHWVGIHGRPRGDDPQTRARCEQALSRAKSGEYVDVHAWQFTPSSFQAVMRMLFDEGEIGLEVARVHDTGFAQIEFMAVLRRPS